MPHRIFLPHPKKRSKALSLGVLVGFNLFFLLLVILKVTSTDYKDFNILGFATNINIQDLLKDTNVEREKYGLNTLKMNVALSKAAEQKAQDMFADDYWNHVAPDGTTPWDFILGNGYSYTYAGENLAKDFMNSSSVVKAWMNSPSHRENMLNEHYTEIGFAVVDGDLNGEKTTLVVQMFGTPSGNVADIDNGQTSTQNSEQVVEVFVQDTSEVLNQQSIQENKEPDILVQEPTVPTVESSVNTNKTSNLITIDRSYVLYGAYAVLAYFIIALFIDGFVAFKNHHLRLTGNTVSHLILFISVLVFIYYINQPLAI